MKVNDKVTAAVALIYDAIGDQAEREAEATERNTHAVLVSRLIPYLKAVCLPPASKGVTDGRLSEWRVNVYIGDLSRGWDEAETIHSRTALVCQGLKGVAVACHSFMEGFYGTSTLALMEGDVQLGNLMRKMENLRPTLSRRAGKAVMRLKFREGGERGAKRVLVCEITKIQKGS